MIPLRILMDVEEESIHDPTKRNLFPGELGDVAVIGALQAGTEEGRPSITVRIDFADGSYVLGQTTLRLLNMAMTAFAARYGEHLL